MPNVGFKGIVFDHFGTLVNNRTEEASAAMVAKVAAAVSCPFETFYPAWRHRWKS